MLLHSSARQTSASDCSHVVCQGGDFEHKNAIFQPVSALHRRCRWLDELCGYVWTRQRPRWSRWCDWVEESAWQDHHPQRDGAIVICQRQWHCTWPRRGHWQSADNGCTRLVFNAVSPTFSFGSSARLQHRCLRKPRSPWRSRRSSIVWTIVMLYFTSSATLVWLLTVCPECSCSSLDRSAATWPYFAGFEATSLVASATHESSTSWPSIERQKFLCRWTTSLEQSIQHSATTWHGLWAIQTTTTEDIFVCLRLRRTCGVLFFLLMRRVSFRNPILDLDMALTVGWDWRCSVGLELMLRHFNVWSGSGQRQYDIGVSVPVSNNSGSCVKGVVDKAILTVDSVSGRRTSVVTMETETCLTVISARSEGRPWEQRRQWVITAVDWRDSGKFCSHFLFIYVILLYIIAVLL